MVGIIEQIEQLREQGYPDDQIIEALKQSGVSPREINDAINQVQIKNAVIGDAGTPPVSGYDQYGYDPGQGQAQTQTTSYATYPSQDTGSSNYGVDTNTIMEIAEKTFEEKIKKFEKQSSELNEFKTLSQTKIENISERLKRIETMFDQLQIKILEKIGTYGENLDSIKKEMSMMGDSFQKMVNPILDKNSEKVSSSSFKQSSAKNKFEEESQEEQGKKQKEEASIDDIFRKAVTKKK